MLNLFRILLVYVAVSTTAQAQTEELSINLGDDREIIVEQYAADGDYLLLWLAPEYGFRQAHQALATALAKQGVEIWQSDIAESLFMPRGTSSLKRLDGSLVADLIEIAHARSAKKIGLVADSYATINALRGARRWQGMPNSKADLVGAVLFTPFSYAYLPSLGMEPEYMPVVEATNIPLMIYQAKNSATFTQFDTLLEKLRKNESPVYTRIVNNVMSLFYEEVPTQAMIDGASTIPQNLVTMLKLLSRHPLPRNTIPIAENTSGKSGIDIYLREFRGATRPTMLDLPDANGNQVVVTDLTGKVRLINFWATWCPPCVEEIPSLNRLQQKMSGRDFELISINYAESADTVAKFLERVEVDFPVLLDLDGGYAKKWNVVSFPSTFVIDKSGNIRYGVNAAIEWDAPELIEKIDSLLN